MNIKKYIFSKSFIKIFTIIILTNLILYSMFFSIFYYIAKKDISNAVEEKHEDITKYIGMQIENMNDIVENYCITQYFSPDVEQLMYQKVDDNFNTFSSINRLSSIANTNLFVKSFTIYNGNLDEFFGIRNFDENISSEFKESIIKGKIPFLQPIPYKVTEDKMELLYLMYDSDINGNIKAAQIINIDLEWLSELIDNLEQENSNIYLYDLETKQIIIGRPINQRTFDESIGKLVDNTLAEKAFSITDEVSKELLYVNATIIPDTGWVMVNEQSYEIAFDLLHMFKGNMVFLAIIIIIISIFVSWIIASKIHYPFRRLYNQLSEADTNNKGIRDDVKLLEQVFKLNKTKIIKLETYKSDTQEIMDRNMLLSLITEIKPSGKVIDSPLENTKDMTFFNKGAWLLISIRIDDFLELVDKPREDINSTKEMIAKIINNSISLKYIVKWIYVGGGEYVLFINVGDYKDINQIEKDFIGFKKEINSYITISTVSIFIDEVVEDLSLLLQSYNNIKKMFEYQLFYDSNCLITTKEINKRENKELVYPHLKPLIDAIKDGSKEEIKEAYKKWRESASLSNIEYFFFHVARLLIAVNQAIKEYNWTQNRITFNIQLLFKDILVSKSIKQIDERLDNLFTMIYESRQREKEVSSSNYMIEAVKEYIELNYHDANISLKTIAQEFKYSATYFGKQFKNCEGVSVSKYIHKIRLNKFIQGLADSNKTTKELMMDVGYENESNFYKIFKQEYGITPKEYRELMIKEKMEKLNKIKKQ